MICYQNTKCKHIKAQYWGYMYLNAARLASALHARGHVDGVAPNVVVRLAGPDDPCRDGSMIDTYKQISSNSVYG